MNELHFAFKVRQHLNRSLHELSPGVTARLKQARNAALGRQKRHQPVFVLAGHAGIFSAANERIGWRHFAIAALLFFMTLTYTQWSAHNHVAEITAIDSAMLSDDIPLEILVDKGFDVWLEQSSAD